jgi:hypothetical protein
MVGRIEGYAIVSRDGMLATADRVMPEAMIFEADQRFFEHALDQVDVVVHGRHSQEQQARSPQRNRLILTTRVPDLAPHPSNPRAWLWNPVGASFEQALDRLGLPAATVGVIGGPDVFALFLGRYDAFHLSRAPNLFLPGGRPVFPDVPAQTPEQVLSRHGLSPDPTQMLDATHGLTLATWRPPPNGLVPDHVLPA